MKAKITSRRAQRGAALFIGMMFLIVLTIFSLTAMRLSTLDERMAGNFIRQAQASKLAEERMAQAVSWVARSKEDPTLAIPSTFKANFGPGTAGSLIEEGSGESSANYGAYEGIWAEWALKETVNSANQGLIEKLDLGLAQGQLEQGSIQVQGGDYFRISTWGNVGDTTSGRASSATVQNFFVP
jgi:Tfp pilus assembly protein PilX